MNTARIENAILEAQAWINKAIEELAEIEYMVDEISADAGDGLRELIQDLDCLESNVASFDIEDYASDEDEDL